MAPIGKSSAPILLVLALLGTGCGGGEDDFVFRSAPPPGPESEGRPSTPPDQVPETPDADLAWVEGVVSTLAVGVPADEIVPDLPIDAIPPLDDPRFDEALAAPVADEAMVVGAAFDGEAFAYPVAILNFHEIVNHQVGTRQVAVTYCPLTNSAAVFDGSSIVFGNTGALYNNNVVMYDRRTESLWSQMAAGALLGRRTGERLALMPVVHTTWRAWRALYPDTKVLSERTGFRRNYAADPFIESGYTVNRAIFFPQSPPIDTRLHPKEMVFGLARDGWIMAYPYQMLAQAGPVNDRLFKQDIAIFYGAADRLALGYMRQFEGRTLHFEAAGEGADGLPRFRDVETGSTWDILGRAEAGPAAGRRLKPIAAYSAYWFSWASFWPGTLIWDGENIPPPEDPQAVSP